MIFSKTYGVNGIMSIRSESNDLVDSLNINITNTSDYPLAIETMYLQVFTCNYTDFSMSEGKPARDVRIDLGTVTFSKDRSTQRVIGNDEVFRIPNYETGFFKLAYNYSAIAAALDCNTNNNRATRSRDMTSSQNSKKVGDVWMYVIIVNPTNGEKVTIRKKIFPEN